MGDLVNGARYSVHLEKPPSGRPLRLDLADRMGEAPQRIVRRVRRGQQEELDILPSIIRIAASSEQEIEMVLRIGEARAARPDDVIRGLYGAEATPTRIVRKELLVLREQDALSPMACVSR